MVQQTNHIQQNISTKFLQKQIKNPNSSVFCFKTFFVDNSSTIFPLKLNVRYFLLLKLYIIFCCINFFHCFFWVDYNLNSVLLLIAFRLHFVFFQIKFFFKFFVLSNTTWFIIVAYICLEVYLFS